MLNEPQCCETTNSLDSRPTITARLINDKKDLEIRLEKINNALELMEANPDVSKILDALGRTYL